jgi:hemerythrin
MHVHWTTELATGIEAIDAEHRELIERMDRFLDACRRGLGKARTLEMLDFLESYAISHFAHEEALMAKSSYPESRTHRAQHTTFRKNVAAIRAAFDQEGATVSVVVLVNRTVIDWMLGHIRNSDRALGDHLVRS